MPISKGLLIGGIIGALAIFAAVFIAGYSTFAALSQVGGQVANVGENTTGLSAADMTATAFCSIPTALPGGASYVLVYDLWGTPTATPTRVGTLQASLTPTPIPVSATPSTGTPQAVALAIVGNPEQGKVVFNTVGVCSSCHLTQTDSVLVGPSLSGIATRGNLVHPDVSAETYIRSVIENPDKALTTLNKRGIMPRSYKITLSEQQISDLVAYLMTLK